MTLSGDYVLNVAFSGLALQGLPIRQLGVARGDFRGLGRACLLGRSWIGHEVYAPVAAKISSAQARAWGVVKLPFVVPFGGAPIRRGASRALAGRPIEGEPDRMATCGAVPDTRPVMLVDPDSRPDFPGDAEADRERCKDVIADCTVAIRRHPNSDRLYLERGDALSWLGHYKEAVADYDRAIALDADNAAAYFGRCRVKSELGLHEEAIEDYDELMRLDPESQCTSGER